MKRFIILFAAATLMIGTAFLTPSTTEGAQGWTGTVISAELNVRTAPSTDSDVVATLVRGDKVVVVDQVQGEAIVGNYATWYQTDAGYYVYGRHVTSAKNGRQSDPLQMSGNAQAGGHWLDCDLSKQVLTAMDGDTAVYGAECTIGRTGWGTPPGSYTILNKVANETMDSSTIGIPNDSPEGWYYTGVLYTQYYTDRGHSIHYNYWVDPAAFGNQATSHGCIGLNLDDAAFMWNWTDVGTPLIIHY